MNCLDENMAIVQREGRKLTGCKCGYILGPATDNYKLHSLMKESEVSKAGNCVNPYHIGGDRFVFRQFFCPGCLTLLGTEIAQKGEALLWDIQIKVES